MPHGRNAMDRCWRRPGSGLCAASLCLRLRTCLHPMISSRTTLQEMSRSAESRSSHSISYAEAEVLGHSPLLRPDVSGVRRFQFFETHRIGGPAWPRGAADRRASEDRVSGRAEAVARGSSLDRDNPIPARFGSTVFAGTGFRRVGASAGDFRARHAPHAERRSVLPGVGGHPIPVGLHHQ